MTDLYLGLMSGTSVDALDIALCSFSSSIKIIHAGESRFNADLRRRIHHFCGNQHISLDELLLLERDYTEFCALAVNRFLEDYPHAVGHIRAIGFHGQTLRHLPEQGCTLQMGNPSLLAELTGIDVIADFRRRDMAAGGQGAPLVPAFHHYLTQDLKRPLALLNLGGIANLSILGIDNSVLGFDTGPANTLMDQWYAKHHQGTYDHDGAWAATGEVNFALLAHLLKEPYFQRKAPKSTGRELFNLSWLEQHLKGFESLIGEDVQRTLLELTAVSVTDALVRTGIEPQRLILCGGGANNRILCQRLEEHLHSTQVLRSDTLGWSADYLEAAAFAWLAAAFIKRTPANLPEVTGARGLRVLGALYPY